MENEGQLACAAKDSLTVPTGAHPGTNSGKNIIISFSKKINIFSTSKQKKPTPIEMQEIVRQDEQVLWTYNPSIPRGLKETLGLLKAINKIIQQYSLFRRSDKNLLKPCLKGVLPIINAAKKNIYDFCKKDQKSLTPFLNNSASWCKTTEV